MIVPLSGKQHSTVNAHSHGAGRLAPDTGIIRYFPTRSSRVGIFASGAPLAGDWIKLEKCSPNKPEVMRLARLWGIPQDQAFGAVVRFWVWIDDACSNGIVTGIALHEVDDMMRFHGFTAGLVAVGWLKINEEIPSITIQNWNRHNGNSAKTRALARDRQSRFRNASVTQTALPEKRREEKRTTTSLRSVVESARKKPQLDAPTDEHRSIAAERGVSCQAEFLKYRDWLAASGKSHKDETAGFRNWLRRAAPEQVAGIVSRAERQARNMEILTGKARTINGGIAERVGGAVIQPIAGFLREPDADDVGERGPDRSAAGVGD